MKLSLALLAGAAHAYSSCADDWYFQEGKSYTYDLTSKLDGQLEFYDSGIPASKVLTGQVSVNTIGDCEAEIHLVSRLGARSQTLVSGLINYGEGELNAVKFDQSNSEAENNMLRAVISALQVNKNGALEYGSVSEQTSSGYSNSFYECNCGCEKGTHCSCEDDCGEVKITKQSHVAIDADRSSVNPLAERLFTKLMFDTEVDLGASTCEVSHKAGVPKFVSCHQDISTSSESSVSSSLTLRQSGEESSKPAKQNKNSYINSSLTITTTDAHQTVCGGDASCIMERIPSIAKAQTDAIKNQYILRREIGLMTGPQLKNLIKAASKHDENQMMTQYLFTEITSCETNACADVIDDITQVASFNSVYPMVYRAAQRNPTENLINLMANDIASESSIEKMDIFNYAVSKVVSESAAVDAVDLANAIISSNCDFQNGSPKSLMDYFSADTNIPSETEIHQLLATLNLFDEQMLTGLDLNKIMACRMISETSLPIAEQAIILLTRMPSQSISTIAPKSYSEYASVILGYSKMGYSPKEIQNTLGNVPEEVSIILRAIDSTHGNSDEGSQLWNKQFNLPLPQQLAEIQHLAGLKLVAEGYQINMQSVHSINRFINGLGENVLEVDFIVNDMVEILESSVNAGVRFSDEEWLTIVKAENSMVSLVEAAINQQFDQILKADVIPSARTFLKMGGVCVKLYGASVELGWIGQILNNIEDVVVAMTQESEIPSLPKLYELFTSGINHEYANVLDSRQVTHMPMVNGMLACITSASISSVNYEGTVLPDLMSLGQTGDLQLNPAVSTGKVHDVSIYGIGNIVKSIQVTDTHFSVGLIAKYKLNSDTAMIKFRLQPTRSSPAHARSQYFVDYELANGVPHSNSVRSTFDLLGSEVVIQADDSGYDLYLKNSITGQISINGLAANSQNHDAQASIDGLGVAKLTQKGTPSNGVVQIKIQGDGEYSEESYAFAIKSDCQSMNSCMVTMAAKSPQTDYMKGSFDLNVENSADYGIPEKLQFNLNLLAGSYQVLDLTSSFDMNEKRLTAGTSIMSSWPMPFDVSIQCQDNILNGFIFGAKLEDFKGATECRVNTGRYDGRGLVQYKNGVVQYTINTPVGTSIGRVNSGSNKRAELSVYKYEAGTFSSFAQMSKEALAEFEFVKIRAASNMQKTQLKVTYQGHDMVALAVRVNDPLHQEVHIEVPVLELDMGYGTAIDMTKMEFKLASFFNWNARVASKSGLPRVILGILSHLTNEEGRITTEFNAQYPSAELCSLAAAEDQTAIVTLGLGKTTNCISASLSEFQVMSKSNPSDPETDFIARAKYTISGTAPEIAIQIKHEMFQTTSSISGQRTDDRVGMSVSSSSLVDGTSHDYNVELSGQLVNGEFLAYLTGDINESPFKYALSGEIKEINVSGTSVKQIILYSAQAREEFGLVELDLYLTESNIPVGIKYTTEDKNSVKYEEFTAIFTGTYGEIAIDTERYTQIQPRISLFGKYDDSTIDLETIIGESEGTLSIDLKQMAVDGHILIESTEFKIEHVRSGHKIMLVVDPDVQASVLIHSDATVDIEKLYLNLKDYDFGVVAFEGQTQVLITDNELETLLVNHHIEVRKNKLTGHMEFTLNAGFNVKNNEAPVINESVEFKFCPQLSHQSWAAVESSHTGMMGIWASHDGLDVPVCINAIQKYPRDSNSNQLALNINDSNCLVSSAVLKSAMRDINLDYKCVNGVQLAISGNIHRQAGALELDMEAQQGDISFDTDFDFDGKVSVGFVFPKLNIEADITTGPDGPHIILNSENSLNPSTYAVHSKTQLGGDNTGLQELTIIPSEYKVSLKHDSTLGKLELETSENDAILSFDIAGNSMNSAAKWESGRRGFNLQATSNGEIVEIPFDITKSITINGVDVEVSSSMIINGINAQNMLVLNTESFDLTFSSETPFGSANIMKDGLDAGIAINVEVSGVPIDLRAQTESENKNNIAFLKVLGVPYFDIKSNQISGEHEVSIHGGSFTGEFDQNNGQFKLKGDISGVTWVGKGVVLAPGVHNSQWTLTYSEQVNVFKQETSELKLAHSLDINDQSASLMIESPLFDSNISAKLTNLLLSGSVNIVAEDVNVSIEEFTVGVDGSVLLFKAHCDTWGSIEAHCDMNSLDIVVKSQQTLSPYLSKLDMDITDKKSHIIAQLSQNNRLQFALDIPKAEADLFLGATEHVKFMLRNGNTLTNIEGMGIYLEIETNALELLKISGNVVDSTVYVKVTPNELATQLAAVGPVNKLIIEANFDSIKIATEIEADGSVHQGVFEADLESFETNLNIESSYIKMNAVANLSAVKVTVDEPRKYQGVLDVDIGQSSGKLFMNQWCDIEAHLPITDDKLFVKMILNDLGRAMVQYHSDNFELEIAGQSLQISTTIKDLTNLQLMSLHSSGAYGEDVKFEIRLDVAQPVLSGVVTIGADEYSLSLDQNTGVLTIPEICQVEYKLTNDMSSGQLSIQSKPFTLLSEVSFADYSCNIGLTTGPYRLTLEHDGLNLSMLKTEVTDDGKRVLLIDLTERKYVIVYPAYPINVQLSSNSHMTTVVGTITIGESTLEIVNIESVVSLPTSGEINLLTYGQDFSIKFGINENGVVGELKSNTFNFNAQTKQHIYLEPLSIESALKMNVFGKSLEGSLEYDNGMTNINANIDAMPLISGLFELEMDGLSVNTLAVENVNFNLMQIVMIGGTSYRDGTLYIAKSQIRDTESGNMYYGLSDSIELDFESGLSSLEGVILQVGPVRFQITYEDVQNFEIVQLLPSENVYMSAKDGVYKNKAIIFDFNIESETTISPMNQMLVVTKNGNEVLSLDVHAELPKALKFELASGNNQMLFQFSGSKYILDASAPGMLTLNIQGQGLDMIQGDITTSLVGVQMDLNKDMKDSHLLLIVDGAEIVTFNAKNLHQMKLSVNAPQTGSLDMKLKGAQVSLDLNAYPYALLAQGDLSQHHLKVILNKGQNTLATLEGEVQSDQITAKIDIANNHVQVGFAPSDKRLRFKVEAMNKFSATGDFSPTYFNILELIGPQGSISCDTDKCEIQSGDLNLEATLVFGESVSFYFGGTDPSVTLVDLKMTGSTGSLDVIFYDIIKAHIERQGKQVRGKAIILDTQLELDSTIGKTFNLSANGPSAEFTIEADREHADWNMTRPIRNVASFDKDELVVVALDRKITVTSVNGLLNVESELA